MKIPGDINREELVKFFKKYGYEITKQTGSHTRLTTHINGTTILQFLNIKF